MEFIRPHRWFIYTVLFIGMSYLIFEYFYIPYGALSADEFVFARHIHDYTFQLPYRDFPPYKTVLGYYLLSIPFFFSQDWLKPLFYIKDEIAIINTFFIFLTAYWSSRFFDQKAVTLTIFAILSNLLFLVYGTDLRVDMLTSWFCLFAALSVLDHRIKLGGFLLGIAFLISQKAIWYMIAINGALCICLLLPYSRYRLASWLRFNLAMALPIVIYFIIFSLLSSPAIVFHSLFYEAYIQAGIDWYLAIFWFCWWAIFYHTPLLFLFWPVSFIMLSKPTEKQIFVICFASIALLQFITYKQPFPYNAVFTIPAFYLLYAEFFSWVFNGLQEKAYRQSLIIIFISMGILFPFYGSLRTCRLLDGHYQQLMLNTARQLLSSNESYLAGVPFYYQKDQPVEGMKNLIGPAIDYLYFPNPKLKPLLLPSLYLSETNTQKVLDDLEHAPVKLIFNNYRIILLPPAIATYLKNNYQQYYGSIYLYAPLIPASQLSFDLKFAGSYRLQTKKSILLDNKRRYPQELLSLKAGDHTTNADQDYRLILIPEKSSVHWELKDQIDQCFLMIKAIVA